MPKARPKKLGLDFVFTTAHPHGTNILKKAADGGSGKRTKLLKEVAARYSSWRTAASIAPTEAEKAHDWRGFVERQVRLFGPYRDSLDTKEVDDAFDSRGALQPSALEELCTYLFQPLLESLGGGAELGKHEVFHGLYFSSADYKSFAKLPEPRYQAASVDFVICKKLNSLFSAGDQQHKADVFVPIVAVECKTYLDRPRWFASEILADNLKRGFPYCRQFLLAEFLKLETSKVNIVGSRVDHIYVLRRTENIDRKVRRAKDTKLPPIHVDAVFHFFDDVRRHLTARWEPLQSWKETGVLK